MVLVLSRRPARRPLLRRAPPRPTGRAASPSAAALPPLRVHPLTPAATAARDASTGEDPQPGRRATPHRAAAAATMRRSPVVAAATAIVVVACTRCLRLRLPHRSAAVCQSRPSRCPPARAPRATRAPLGRRARSAAAGTAARGARARRRSRRRGRAAARDESAPWGWRARRGGPRRFAPRRWQGAAPAPPGSFAGRTGRRSAAAGPGSRATTHRRPKPQRPLHQQRRRRRGGVRGPPRTWRARPHSHPR